MTLSDRSMCMIPRQVIGSPFSFLFLIRLFVDLRVGNEKKHTYLAYIAKSKTGPNRENRPYNQIKMCMCVESFWMELAPLSAWLYLLFWNMGYLSFFFHASGHRHTFYFFFFFPCFWAWTHFLFSFLLHSPYFYHNEYEESCQRDGAFLCGWEAYFCVTSNIEVSMYIWSARDLNL